MIVDKIVNPPLVLSRLKAGGSRRIVTTPKEPKDARAQFSQRRVFAIANSPSHIFFVSYYDINASRHCFEADRDQRLPLRR
jgi:hypothetical protein